ncbi:MAG TPA: hypothetical protein DCY59_06340 [Micrococcaceae bacterium]|nr:hypothetical protein [Micrococcaceae bacterium]
MGTALSIQSLSQSRSTTVSLSPERQDILDLLAEARFFLKYTTRELSDDQARFRPTSSALCLGGLITHVTVIADSWARFGRPGLKRAHQTPGTNRGQAAACAGPCVTPHRSST